MTAAQAISIHRSRRAQVLPRNRLFSCTGHSRTAESQWDENRRQTAVPSPAFAVGSIQAWTVGAGRSPPLAPDLRRWWIGWPRKNLAFGPGFPRRGYSSLPGNRAYFWID